MADKPSRSLVVFGDGLAPSIGSEHTHLHSLASKALCGFLGLPNAPPSETKDERVLREFALLLDSFDLSTISEKPSNSTISERFMGMKAALFTDHSSLTSFAEKLGFTVTSLSKCRNGLLSYLGFIEGEAPGSHFDVVFVHTGAGEELSCDIERVNDLVANIMQEAQSRSEIGASLHLSVVMSYGKVPEGSDSNLSLLSHKCKEKPYLSKLFPRQSYILRGEDPRDNVRHHCPMLMAQWQDGVTRRDKVDTFSFEDFKEHGGNLVIPADRFLHEIAFKVWKAPKYGA